MKVEEKIKSLKKLYKKIKKEDNNFFMCNILDDIIENDNDKKSLLNELWKDRDKKNIKPFNVSEKMMKVKRPYVWYDMKIDKENVRVRKQNVSSTIKRLEKSLEK